MELDEVLVQIVRDYPQAVEEPFSGHPLADMIRRAASDSLQDVVGTKYKVAGSPGLGRWAETPWIAVFLPQITLTAQSGYYVVYLFRRDGSCVFLSLNQATTEVRRDFGRSFRLVLEDRGRYAIDTLSSFDLTGLHLGPIDLGSTGSLTRGYESGNIASIVYNASELPDSGALRVDLARMLNLYDTYAAARQGGLGGSEDIPADLEPGEEGTRYRWHRRAERNQGLARRAKAAHGYVCKVCRFDFEAKYGEVGYRYIEAHHLVPMAQLAAAPEPSILDPLGDFTVVCANCHRMLHRKHPVLSPEELVELIERTRGADEG